MAHFAGSEASTAAAVGGADLPDLGGMEWDDVDAFLDDYLKEMGPGAAGPDQFGNFSIDFAGRDWATPPAVPTAVPADSTQQQAATMLTSQLRAQALDAPDALQRASSEAVQQPARPARARRGGAAAASARTASGGAAGARGGAKESRKELDAKKHLALQEKNRRAQRRFRERQKQRVAELEEQVATLSAQLAAAQAQRGGCADAMQHDGERGRLASPRAVVGAQVPAASSHPASDEEAPLAHAASDASLTLTVGAGHPLQLTARQLADMTPAELARHYKGYVNELAGILVESDDPAAAPTQERVRRLVEEVCALMARTAVCNPAGSKHFALARVDDVANQPADARVPQIARALDISAPQRRQLGQLRGMLLQQLARVAAERRDISAQLAGAVPGGTGGRQLAQRYLVAHDCTRRLRESLREEHALLADFAGTLHKHVFTPQQVAQFMIQSYPWTPDALALCTWVAAEDGDAAALSLLAAEAQSKAAAAAQAASTGGPAGSGGSAGGGLGVGTPHAPLFMPTAFAGAPAQHPLYGQQHGGALGGHAAASPQFAHSDALNNLAGQSHSVSSALHLPGGAACLGMPPPALPHLAGAGSGKQPLLSDLGGCVPPLPDMAALSSVNGG